MKTAFSKNNLTHKKIIIRIWLTALLVTPFLLWLMPATLFDETGVEICPSKFFFDVECFGCGMTRAVMHLHHFNWREALYFNYGVVLVYPALVFIWFVWTNHAWKNK